MEIRRLNPDGIEEFQNYLHAVATGTPLPAPARLLSDNTKTTIFTTRVELEQRTFASRLEVARYLDGVISQFTSEGIENDIGLWTWLSLFFFDELSPPETGGSRKPGEDARWILDPRAWKYYRHLLAGPWRIFKIFKDHTDDAAILLYQDPRQFSDYVEQLASRQEIVTNKGIISAATALYFDPRRNTHKRGGQNRTKPGTLRRFIAFLEQLDLTHDLYSFNDVGGVELLNKLPAEFDPWKSVR